MSNNPPPSTISKGGTGMPKTISSNAETPQEQTSMIEKGDQHASFLDQRQETVEPPHLLPPAPMKAFNKFAMPDNKMTAEDILKNPIVVGNFNWTVADVVGTNLFSLPLPAVIANFDSFHRLMFQTYAFFKCNIKLRFQMNSNKFQLGRLMPFIDPVEQMIPAQNFATNAKFINIYSASSNPGTILDASLCNVGSLIIPFEHIQDYLTTNSKETFDMLAVVHVLVLNQLAVAAGALGTVNVQVLLSCEDIEMHAPIHPHMATIPTFLRAEMQSSTIDEGFKAVAGAGSAAYNIYTGNFGKAATSAATSLEGIGNLLQSINLDKPAHPMSNVSNALSPFAPLSHGTGVDGSVRLGNAPLGTYLEHKSFSNMTANAMDVNARVQIPGLIKQMVWSTGAPQGTVLMELPVMPDLTFFDVPNPAGYVADFTRCYSTNLSYIARMFQFWRGSIQFRIDAVSSLFHTGRLALVFVPNQGLTQPANLQQFTNCAYAVFDIKEQKSLQVACPYQSSLPRKSWAPVGPEGTITNFTDQHLLGYFFVVVQNQLTAPSNVAPAIDLNIYISGGPDMEFEFPRLLQDDRFQLPLAAPVAERIKAEMQADAEMVPIRTINPDSIPLNKGPATVSRMNVFNEGVRDLREIARKFAPIAVLRATFTTIQHLHNSGTRQVYTSRFAFPVTPFTFTGTMLDGATTELGTSFDAAYFNYDQAYVFMNRISRMNAFWHGGIRYKFQPFSDRTHAIQAFCTYDPTSQLPVTVDPEDFVESPLIHIFYDFNNASHVTNLSQSCSLQVECPFFSGYNQLMVETTDPVNFTDDRQCGYLYLKLLTDDISTLPVDTDGNHFMTILAYASAADDIHFTYPVAPPVIFTRQKLLPPPP